MARRLPPLNAVRAFEAAARHLSFTRAADELNVTQAAISHQVKALEEHLGLPLFRRLNRRLLLTDEGQAYLPPLRDALDGIDAATRRLTRQETPGGLKVSVLPSFAAKWLLPRLPRFRERHPDLDVLVSAVDALVDFVRDDVDLGIRYGRGVYPDLKVDILMRDEAFPVCSPKLLEGPNALKSPADLKNHVLLHDTVIGTEEDPDWRTWLEASGLPTNGPDGIDPSRGPGFSHASMVIEAAVTGQGVALTRRSLTIDDITAGRLVAPFGPRMPSAFVYSIVCLPEVYDLPKVRLFRDWLIEEARSGVAGVDLKPIPTPMPGTKP